MIMRLCARASEGTRIVSDLGDKRTSDHAQPRPARRGRTLDETFHFAALIGACELQEQVLATGVKFGTDGGCHRRGGEPNHGALFHKPWANWNGGCGFAG
jgi:hypothetical protein